MEGQQKSEYTIFIRILNGYFPKQLTNSRRLAEGKPLRSIFQNSKGFKSAQDNVRKII